MTAPALRRSAGVLLHPTSLPGPFGVGDLGPVAYRWVETLAAMKQTWWQILPLGPSGAGDSPYQSFSAFAGNPLMINGQRLAEVQLLVSADLESLPPGDPDRVVFGGDWPVCTKAATYAEWLTAFRQIIASRPEADQKAILHDNAVKYYGL